MGNVVLIGGSPMTGKSTAAVALATSLHCPCISTDDIGEALQTVASINPMQGRDFRDYYAATPIDELIADTKRYHRAMEPAINRLVDIHSTWGNSLIIEGWALYPERIRPLLRENVCAVWLIAGEGLLEARLAQRSDFLNGDAADYYLMRSKWHNDLLLRECKSLKLPYLFIHDSENPASLAEKIHSRFPWF